MKKLFALMALLVVLGTTTLNMALNARSSATNGIKETYEAGCEHGDNELSCPVCNGAGPGGP